MLLRVLLVLDLDGLNARLQSASTAQYKHCDSAIVRYVSPICGGGGGGGGGDRSGGGCSGVLVVVVEAVVVAIVALVVVVVVTEEEDEEEVLVGVVETLDVKKVNITA